MPHADQKGCKDRLERLLAGRGDVNAPDVATGEAPLILAAQLQPPVAMAMMPRLLDAGADIRCESAAGVPLPFLLVGWEDHPRSCAAVELLLDRGLDVNVARPAGDADTLLLAALKAGNGALAGSLLSRGAQADRADAAGNTPLHVAGAAADAELASAIIERGGSARLKNADGHTPTMCARLGAIAPGRRLSRTWRWCTKDVLKSRERDAVDNAMLEKGEEVWRCPATKECFSALSDFNPAYPRNHAVSSVIALSSGDAYSLTDAVEGAWLCGEAPPHKPQAEVNPDIMRAIQALVHVIQLELKAGFELRDQARLGASLEMVRYARVANLPEEAVATRMLAEMELEQALASRDELELKQALISATQYGLTALALFKKAHEALEGILEDRHIKSLFEQLVDATRKEDIDTLHALLQATGTKARPECEEITEARDVMTRCMRRELNQAVGTCDKNAVKAACGRVERLGLTGLPEYRRLLELRKHVCVQSLQSVAAARDEEKLKEALVAALEDPDLEPCGLRADPDFRGVVQVYRDLLSLPPYFDEELLIEKVSKQISCNSKQKQLQFELLDMFQQLLDKTHRRVITKDRRGRVPMRLLVRKVDVVQNTDNFLSYMLRREEIRCQLAERPDDPQVKLGVPGSQACKTLCRLRDGRRFHTAWRDSQRLAADPIDLNISELYLFHGTKPSAATAIADGDFRMDLAGSHAGTLYGRGIYFSECSSKSDEYAEEDARGLNALLVCRVVLGRIYYTDEEYPVTRDLVSHCTGGEYHSVLGDREKCRGTFREMIIYDSDQVYPEFIIWYTREM